MVYTLTMTFIGSSGEKVAFSIDGVKEGITAVEAGALMDLIIEEDIFLTKKGSLIEKSSAQLVQRAVTKFEVA